MDAGELDRWRSRSLGRLRADAAPTPLVALPAPLGVRMLVKDESAQPTGSLKHRLVRALLVEAVERGTLRPGSTVVAGTGGAAAVAGAFFADALGLGFLALVPEKTPQAARARIERYGGRVRTAAVPAAVQEEARRLAAAQDAFFLDHFSPGAVRAMAACGVPTLAEELFAAEGDAAWVVVGAATGVTATTLGRFVRAEGRGTAVAVVDPENSAYFPGWATGSADYATGMPSRVPGIGRPRMEPGFDPDVVDLVIPVRDRTAAAGARWLNTRAGVGLDVGPAAGAGLWGACHLAARLRAADEPGSVVLVAGDGGGPYRGSARLGGGSADQDEELALFDDFFSSGRWP